MKAKYTPGPWRTGHHGEWVIAQDPEIGESVVAIVEGPSWKANALLMASAPDLLAACLKLVEGADQNNTPLKREIRDAIVLARAAIAKAEGVSHA